MGKKYKISFCSLKVTFVQFPFFETASYQYIWGDYNVWYGFLPLLSTHPFVCVRVDHHHFFNKTGISNLNIETLFFMFLNIFSFIIMLLHIFTPKRSLFFDIIAI